MKVSTSTLKNIAIQQVLARCKVELEKANKMFNLNLDPEICTKLKGKSAGKATHWKFQGKMRLSINVEMMMISEQNWWTILDNTISHEIAHLVDYATRGFSKHDAKWSNTHKQLGGTGAQYHNMTVKPVRKEYIYATTAGDVKITSVRHNKIQKKGASYGYRGAKLNRDVSFRQADVIEFMDSVPQREGEAIVPVQKPVETTKKPVEKKAKKVVAPKAKSPENALTAPSGLDIDKKYRPTAASQSIWLSGATDKETFATKSGASEKTAYKQYRRCVRWFIGA